MTSRRRLLGIATATAVLLSSILTLLSQSASAASWTETSDADFGDGDFLIGPGDGIWIKVVADFD